MTADEPRGRGRPTTGTRIEVRIPPNLLEAIDTMAAAEGTDRAVIIRQLIKRALS